MQNSDVEPSAPKGPFIIPTSFRSPNPNQQPQPPYPMPAGNEEQTVYTQPPSQREQGSQLQGSHMQGYQQGEPDIGYLQYAVEIQIFAFVGWGWLSVREYLGQTPVVDVVVVGMTLLTSIVNTIAGLTCGDAELFQPFARAFLSHSVALVLFYSYSLSESLASNSPSIPCQGNATGVLSSTYKEAYFGGLMLHQAFASVTLAFLVVAVMLGVSQARACGGPPSAWLLRWTNQTFMILVGLHLVFFSLHAPLVISQTSNLLIIAVLSLVGLALIVMVDIEWIVSVLAPSSTEHSKRDDRIWQEALELISIALVGAGTNMLSIQLFSALSVPLAVFAGLSLLLSAVVFVNEAFVKPYAGVPAPSVPTATALGQRHRQGTHGGMNYRGFFETLRQTPRKKSKGM